MSKFRFIKVTSISIASVIALAGCAVETGLPTVDDVFGPETIGNSSLQRPTPDARGIMTYPNGQQAIAASGGENLGSIAARVGMSESEIAAANGLPLSGYIPAAGELIVLPRPVAVPTAPQSSTNSVSTPTPTETTTPTQTAPTQAQHQVVAGETVYGIAKRYGVTADAIKTANSLNDSYAISVGQTLTIPGIAAEAETDDTTQPGEDTPVSPPPSSTEPLPEDEKPAAVPDSPNMAANNTKLMRPVDGKVASGYTAASGGVDYSTANGAKVVAAGNGEVIHISDALGSLGKIVIIRHTGNLVTVYGKVDNLSVSKGTAVSRGQKIGSVKDTSLRFEVREGSTGVDPTKYF